MPNSQKLPPELVSKLCEANPDQKEMIRELLVPILGAFFEEMAKSAALVEREGCAKALDDLVTIEDASEKAATNESWRTIAQSMKKAYRSGARIIRAR